MTYLTLGLIILPLSIIIAIILCVITDSCDCLCIILLGFMISIILWTTQGILDKRYFDRDYDLKGVYEELQKSPEYTKFKTIHKDVDGYIDYRKYPDASTAYEDNILVTHYIGGKKSVRYFTYGPTEKAIERNDTLERIETHKKINNEENNEENGAE